MCVSALRRASAVVACQQEANVPFNSNDLELAERHVSEAEQHLLSQEQVISRLRLSGESSELAEDVLRTFEESLTIKRRDRDLISAQLAGVAAK